jgi:dGTPase
MAIRLVENPSLLLPPAIAAVDHPLEALAARAYAEPPHPYRTPFARDCARVLHARAFRRLAGKTQVFTRRGAESDHSRSRLTHTLEVAQIARTLASALGLNAPLAEALALVHDIGHPPFGHAGEKALDTALRVHGLGFDHNLHALRIVTSFEQRYAAFPGLNLTFAVREGIVKHSRDYSAPDHPELAEFLLGEFPPLEAQLIDLADEIAYLTADMEDGLEAEILKLDELRAEVPLFEESFALARDAFPAAGSRMLTFEALKRMLNALVTDLMRETAIQVRSLGIETLAHVRHAPRRLAQLSPAIESRRKAAKQFLYDRLYEAPVMAAEHAHAEEVIHTLFRAWTQDPALLPPDHQARVAAEGAPQAVADYIAGMTDTYIEQAWRRHTPRNPGQLANSLTC